MSKWSKYLWGGLGWAVGGPIGGIIGFALGAVMEHSDTVKPDQTTTRPGDFGVVLLILCGAVMKADEKILKSELEYVKNFFIQQFGVEHTKERMLLFREILKQDYSVADVCAQVRMHLDHPSKLQLLHLLFGVSMADGQLHAKEIETIATIAGHLNISREEFESVKAMFVTDTTSAYRILEITPEASDEEVKKAYRKMAAMHHPDKVHHLGEDFRKSAQEKFKSINEAYSSIKKERGMA
jgi:DnaJ like chaperone protein